jgi:nucleoside-diphosphate-sugar epimerase
VENFRSLISVRNLADATMLAAMAPGLPMEGAVYTLNDGEDVSTRLLVEAIGVAVGKPARLVPIPLTLLRFAGRLIRKEEAIRRLTSNLQVDGDAARVALRWAPQDELGTALRRMFMPSDSELNRPAQYVYACAPTKNCLPH